MKSKTAKRLGVDPYDVLTQIAKRVQPGADGLIFHPDLAGERAPLWNANARGSFFGLTLSHKKEQVPLASCIRRCSLQFESSTLHSLK